MQAYTNTAVHPSVSSRDSVGRDISTEVGDTQEGTKINVSYESRSSPTFLCRILPRVPSWFPIWYPGGKASGWEMCLDGDEEKASDHSIQSALHIKGEVGTGDTSLTCCTNSAVVGGLDITILSLSRRGSCSVRPKSLSVLCMLWVPRQQVLLGTEEHGSEVSSSQGSGY